MLEEGVAQRHSRTVARREGTDPSLDRLAFPRSFSAETLAAAT